MAWETKDVFTALGAGLGTLAFLQNTYRSVVTENKEKWKSLQQICTKSDFEVVLWALGKGETRVDGDCLKRILDLCMRIQHKNEEVAFKTVFFNSFKRHLEFLQDHGMWLDYDVIHCCWTFDLPATIPGVSYCVLNPALLDRSNELADTTEEDLVEAHLDEMHATIYCMLQEYKAIERKANRGDFEYVLPWKWWRYR
ncbi:MAG: hypothetical protein IPJ76_00380 [Flavobacteriales bacterium]|nr:MAG: hypothetical protein IPJ76_00380 [Flavobacteriales bacterium]